MICTMLHCARSVSLDICRAERYVCLFLAFLFSWAYQLIHSCHVLFSACMLQYASVMPLVIGPCCFPNPCL